jgi:hypothetical protein
MHSLNKTLQKDCQHVRSRMSSFTKKKISRDKVTP